MLEEYYRESLTKYHQALVDEHINGKDKDISDIIRGKIMLLNEILNLEGTLEAFNKLDTSVKEEENKQAKEKGAA